VLRRLRAVFRRQTVDREMRDEMESHLARATERLIERGMTPEAARLEARREFGNVGVLQEEGRDARGTQRLESLIGDARFALRHFSRRPLSALTIVVVLALGIGGHSAVFSVMQAMLVRPAPGVPNDDALVFMQPKQRPRDEINWYARYMSYPEWRDIAANRDAFASVAAWTTADVVLDAKEGEGATGRAHFVTDSYFPTLGVPLALGVGFSPDAGVATDPPAIIGYALWHDAFGGAPDVIGKTVRVNDVTAHIVGVAPERFNGVRRTTGARFVWLPLASRASVLRLTADPMSDRDALFLMAFARLRAETSIEQASAAMAIADTRAVAQMTPDSVPSVYTSEVVRLSGVVTALQSAPRNQMDALQMGAAFGTIALLVLIVACTNVSAIAVGAAVARRHEIAVRMSLGASRMRVVRQLLTESVLLAMAGGALGLAVYWGIVRAIASQITDVDLAPDLGTVAFTMIFALGTGIVFGLSPALHATRQSVGDVLKDSTAGATARSRLQRVFVVAQIAFTQPLLVGLAMMLGVIAIDERVAWRGDLDNRIAIMKLYPRTPNVDEAQRALQRVDARLAEIPGVVKLVRGSEGFRNTVVSVHPDDRVDTKRAAEPLAVHLEGGSPDYFALLDVPIVRGRELVRGDTVRGMPTTTSYASSTVVRAPIGDQNIVIGSDVAHDLWAGGDPIGKRFIETLRDGQARMFTVVGVFDASYATPRGAGNRFYLMSNQVGNTYLIRAAGPVAPLFATMRATVRSELPTSPIERLETIRDREAANALEAFQATASAAAGGVLALLLASIGLYGVVALAVTQRRREIGVRMALGARATQVVGMLFASGVRLSVLGLVLGLPFSVIALRVLADQAHFPKTSAVLVGGGIAIAVISVASLATWIPARRAATIDPVSALRSE
jgi:predicted permease